MSAVAAGIVVAGVGGAYIASNAANSAADKQVGAANSANQTQMSEFQQQQANQAPWMKAGAGALSQLQDPSFQHNFGMSDFQQDPAYQFDLQQGQQAIERSAAARGGLATGGTLKDLTSYAQGQASNEYQSAYNRFTNNQNNSFNRLASIAGLGQTANGQMMQGGMNMANQVGENTMGSANAQGAAGIAGANAWGGTLSNLGNMGFQGAMMSKYGYHPYSYDGSGAGFANGISSQLSTTPELTMPALGGTTFAGGAV